MVSHLKQSNDKTIRCTIIILILFKVKQQVSKIIGVAILYPARKKHFTEAKIVIKSLYKHSDGFKLLFKEFKIKIYKFEKYNKYLLFCNNLYF